MEFFRVASYALSSRTFWRHLGLISSGVSEWIQLSVAMIALVIACTSFGVLIYPVLAV